MYFNKYNEQTLAALLLLTQQGFRRSSIFDYFHILWDYVSEVSHTCIVSSSHLQSQHLSPVQDRTAASMAMTPSIKASTAMVAVSPTPADYKTMFNHDVNLSCACCRDLPKQIELCVLPILSGKDSHT